jgi:hypothetical protein
MDKITQTINPPPQAIGSVVHPLSANDLSSDFTSMVDPSAAAAVAIEASLIEPLAVEPPSQLSESQLQNNSSTSNSSGDLGGPSMPPSFLSSSSSPGSPISPKDTVAELWKNPFVRWGLLGFLAVLTLGLGTWAIMHFGAKGSQSVTTSQADKGTLFIDTKKKTVGVKSGVNPDGLEVQATATTKPQGSANVRLGLVNGIDPSLLFEDGKANMWQVLGSGGALQFIQGDTARAKIDQNALSLTNALNVGGMTNANGGLTTKGDTTLGDNAANTLTIQGSKIALPNGLNFSNNTLNINGGNGTVAIGAASSGGYKLLVAGGVKINGSLTLDGKVLAGGGSAAGPGFAFANNPNTGIYQAAINVVGVSAAGAEVLQVQPGSVLTVNGASLEVDGYIRAGRGGSNPAWQVARFTGTLDGSGGAFVGDGVSNDNTRALSATAFYRGNSNEAVPMSVDNVNGNGVRISGGIPGRQYRVTLMYSQDSAGW